MEELKISAFEKALIDLCNGVPIANRAKYYVLKDVADKCLEASNREIEIVKDKLQKEKEKEDAEH